MSRTDALATLENPLALVRRAARDEVFSRGGSLSQDRFDDLVSFLYLQLLRLAETWEPARARVTFGRHAYTILRFRYTDWLRLDGGDARSGTWIGGDRGDREHRHAPVDERDRAVGESRQCACGATWLSDAGREQGHADPTLLVVVTAPDAQDFSALVDELDHDRLSSRARDTLNFIVRGMVELGLSATEAAARLAKTRREGESDLKRLRSELVT